MADDDQFDDVDDYVDEDELQPDSDFVPFDEAPATTAPLREPAEAARRANAKIASAIDRVPGGGATLAAVGVAVVVSVLSGLLFWRKRKPSASVKPARKATSSAKASASGVATSGSATSTPKKKRLVKKPATPGSASRTPTSASKASSSAAAAAVGAGSSKSAAPPEAEVKKAVGLPALVRPKPSAATGKGLPGRPPLKGVEAKSETKAVSGTEAKTDEPAPRTAEPAAAIASQAVPAAPSAQQAPVAAKAVRGLPALPAPKKKASTAAPAVSAPPSAQAAPDAPAPKPVAKADAAEPAGKPAPQAVPAPLADSVAAANAAAAAALKTAASANAASAAASRSPANSGEHHRVMTSPRSHGADKLQSPAKPKGSQSTSVKGAADGSFPSSRSSRPWTEVADADDHADALAASAAARERLLQEQHEKLAHAKLNVAARPFVPPSSSRDANASPPPAPTESSANATAAQSSAASSVTTESAHLKKQADEVSHSSAGTSSAAPAATAGDAAAAPSEAAAPAAKAAENGAARNGVKVAGNETSGAASAQAASAPAAVSPATATDIPSSGTHESPDATASAAAPSPVLPTNGVKPAAVQTAATEGAPATASAAAAPAAGTRSRKLELEDDDAGEGTAGAAADSSSHESSVPQSDSAAGAVAAPAAAAVVAAEGAGAEDGEPATDDAPPECAENDSEVFEHQPFSLLGADIDAAAPPTDDEKAADEKLVRIAQGLQASNLSPEEVRKKGLPLLLEDVQFCAEHMCRPSKYAEHASTAADFFFQVQAFEEAEKMLDGAIQSARMAGNFNLEATLVNNMGTVLRKQRKFKAALSLHRQHMATVIDKHGLDSQYVALARNNLVEVLELLKLSDDALQLLHQQAQECLARAETAEAKAAAESSADADVAAPDATTSKQGASPVQAAWTSTARCYLDLARFTSRCISLPAAAEHARTALAYARRGHGTDLAALAVYLSFLGGNLKQQAQMSRERDVMLEAREVFRELTDIIETADPISRNLPALNRTLAELSLELGEPEEAYKYGQQVVSVMAQIMGGNQYHSNLQAIWHFVEQLHTKGGDLVGAETARKAILKCKAAGLKSRDGSHKGKQAPGAAGGRAASLQKRRRPV